MKKFITFIIVLVLAFAYAIYNKEQLNIWFAMNNHQQAANQFWFTQKHNLDETGENNLPFNNNVSSFEYVLHKPVQQDGKYYFETTLFINQQYPFPLYTVVEAVDGVWKVNINETFDSAGSASLSYYMERYFMTIGSADKFLLTGHRKIDKQEIDAQLKMIKQMYNDEFIN
ncbi:hypothetical protein [Pseudoalteromonas nigrifaciens]|uniref:hypothetical protein n=1 Tax=Pseudoalteromonas nigrifaciens TaxID=28109 RepID=UPI003FD66073